MLIPKSAEVVHHGHNPTVRRSAVQHSAQSSSNHLHVADWTEDLTRDEDHVGARGVEAGAEHRVIAKDSDFTRLKF